MYSDLHVNIHGIDSNILGYCSLRGTFIAHSIFTPIINGCRISFIGNVDCCYCCFIVTSAVVYSLYSRSP